MNLNFRWNILWSAFVFLNIFSISDRTYANECATFISQNMDTVPTIILPGKGHEFTTENLSAISETNKYLIYAFRDALNTLDHAEVVTALKNINQPLSYYVDIHTQTIEIPSVLKNLTEKHQKSRLILDHYLFFTSLLGTDNYSERARIGLALLFGFIQRPQKPIFVIPDQLSIDDPRYKKINDYFHALIQSHHIAYAIISFLENPYVEFITQEGLNSQLQSMLAKSQSLLNNNFAPLDERAANLVHYAESQLTKSMKLDSHKIKNEYLKKKRFSSQSFMQIGEVINQFTMIIVESFNSKIETLIANKEIESSVQDFEDMSYEYRREYIETFLAEISGFTSGLDTIVSLIDHLNFGSSIPLKSDQIESQMHEALKYWLMPARSEISALKVQSQKTNGTPKITNTQKIKDETLLKAEWGHVQSSKEPQLNPNKRKNKTHFEVTNNVEVSASEIQSSEIPSKFNLYNYSIFADKPLAISDLEPHKKYQFRFMREGDSSKIQSVEFSKEVLDEFNTTPQVAKFLIRALNLGFARSLNEDGLKILKANKPGIEGRFYELKSMKSHVRLILHHVNGQWRALKYTDKTNLNRVVNDLL